MKHEALGSHVVTDLFYYVLLTVDLDLIIMSH